MDSFYHCINVNKSEFKGNDYDCMIVAFDDKDGNSVFRDDWDEARIKENFLSQENENLSFENIFNQNTKASQQSGSCGLTVNQKSWAERVESTL